MGGWISLIVSKQKSNYVHGLVGIASAPDFVVGEWNRLSIEQKKQIKSEGKIIINWDKYAEDYTITYKFLEDGKKYALNKANKYLLSCKASPWKERSGSKFYNL